MGPPAPPPVPADITALAKLRALAQSDWLAAGKIKEYYSGISEILRAYLEGQYRVPALERTTSELMRDLRKRSDPSVDLQAELQQLLEESDLVKFAKFRPEAAEGAQTLEAAIKFVESTRPRGYAGSAVEAGNGGQGG